ncbi:MAG: hypothetical protein M0P91_11975 [Sulfuricurvum sp.]|jgi:uncharacterized protein (DUF302 family)|uniref:hypothetical protein n=1 Tax=Sulfuricurvum sp. TaxID=2025608 RepID=UPI0025ED4EDD|nr:hypothetical protein [Sulfuricurvum sp.]MCK9373902.1 hypothetical protein [Sulfuricurvum sp.]
MFNRLLIGAAALSLAASMAFGAQGVKFYVGDGDKEKEYMSMVNEKIAEIGFVLSDPHERINDGYKTKYGSTNLDNLGFFSIMKDTDIGPLLVKEPSLGGFSPFNLHIYKKQEENKTYVGHIMPDTMLDIVGVKEKAVREKFVASFGDLDQLVSKEIGATVQTVDYKALPAKPMMTFEMNFERGANLQNFIDDFQGKFEAKFEEKKYIIAGFKNVKEAMADKKVEFGRYDAYWVYSLCHFKFSEGIFNQGRPDAGAFAPCSMYMYVDKGSNKLMIGMPRLENWIAVMGIKDQKMVDSIHDLDKEIIGIMTELGAKEL